MITDRRADLDRFYQLLARLEDTVSGKQRLADCDGYMDWPERGVYFFFAPREQRANSSQLRLTRVGTHAVSEGSGTKLWDRLRTHRGALSGSYEGGGNHRGSVFRKRVGEAIIERHALQDEFPEWGDGSSAGRELRLEELEMERRVSEYLRDLPFLWVVVDDEPGSESDRAVLEQNAIALVSNYGKSPIDPRSNEWLGKDCPSQKIRESGLWNVDHVEESYDPAFLDQLAGAIEETNPPSRTSANSLPERGRTSPKGPEGKLRICRGCSGGTTQGVPWRQKITRPEEFLAERNAPPGRMTPEAIGGWTPPAIAYVMRFPPKPRYSWSISSRRLYD